VKGLMLEILGEPDFETFLDLEEKNEEEMVHTWKGKEKSKLVYMIDDDEFDTLDIDQNEGTHEEMDTVDEKARMYHAVMNTNK
ncbi:hypothetical protein KI387_018417, partial [Taxus chinensis]